MQSQGSVKNIFNRIIRPSACQYTLNHPQQGIAPTDSLSLPPPIVFNFKSNILDWRKAKLTPTAGRRQCAEIVTWYAAAGTNHAKPGTGHCEVQTFRRHILDFSPLCVNVELLK